MCMVATMTTCPSDCGQDISGFLKGPISRLIFLDFGSPAYLTLAKFTAILYVGKVYTKETRQEWWMHIAMVMTFDLQTSTCTNPILESQ